MRTRTRTRTNNGAGSWSGLARLVGLLTAGPTSFFVTGVTLPGVTLLQVLGSGVRDVFLVLVLLVREEWVLG